VFVSEQHFGPAVDVRSECVVTQLIPWEAQYPHQGTAFMENAFINEYAPLMAGNILRTVAWIFMQELWSLRKSDAIVHEKEGCRGINVSLVYFYSFAYTFL
jgi:hypothetical protein